MALFNNARKKTINGKEVTIFLLPASKGLVTAKKLSQVLLPTIGAFADGTSGDGLDLSMPAAILVDSLDSLDVMAIVSILLEQMCVDGREVNFDEYFMANYGELFEVIKFALEENFSSFFTGSGIAKMLRNKLPKMPTAAE